MLIARIDTHRRYVFVNPAYAERFGSSPAAIVGRTVREVVGESLYVSIESRLDAVLRGERVEFEERVAFPVGDPVTARVVYEPERDAAGRVTGAVAVIVNLTRQVQAIEAWRDSERTLRAFFDSAPVCMGVVELLDDGDILHVDDNPASCRFFGLPDGGTRGRRASELGVGADTIAAWRRRYLESAALDAPVTYEYRFETPGGESWLAVTVAVVPHASAGAPPRWCYVADDMTPRKLVQQELAAREEELRTLADNMSQFAWTADASGDIDWYNRRWFDYTGTTLDEMRGWGWRSVHHPPTTSSASSRRSAAASRAGSRGRTPSRCARATAATAGSSLARSRSGTRRGESCGGSAPTPTSPRSSRRRARCATRTAARTSSSRPSRTSCATR